LRASLAAAEVAVKREAALAPRAWRKEFAVPAACSLASADPSLERESRTRRSRCRLASRPCASAPEQRQVEAGKNR
jgi:hypothetical protein